jgi:hypothetical protein
MSVMVIDTGNSISKLRLPEENEARFLFLENLIKKYLYTLSKVSYFSYNFQEKKSK